MLAWNHFSWLLGTSGGRCWCFLSPTGNDFWDRRRFQNNCFQGFSGSIYLLRFLGISYHCVFLYMERSSLFDCRLEGRENLARTFWYDSHIYNYHLDSLDSRHCYYLLSSFRIADSIVQSNSLFFCNFGKCFFAKGKQAEITSEIFYPKSTGVPWSALCWAAKQSSKVLRLFFALW